MYRLYGQYLRHQTECFRTTVFIDNLYVSFNTHECSCMKFLYTSSAPNGSIYSNLAQSILTLHEMGVLSEFLTILRKWPTLAFKRGDSHGKKGMSWNISFTRPSVQGMQKKK